MCDPDSRYEFQSQVSADRAVIPWDLRAGRSLQLSRYTRLGPRGMVLRHHASTTYSVDAVNHPPKNSPSHISPNRRQVFRHKMTCFLQITFCKMSSMLKHPDFANPVLSEKEARELFAPYASKIVALMNSAWRQWESCPQRTMLDARTRASFLSSVFRHEAKAAFSTDPNVSFTEKRNSFFLYLGTEAKARFKKLKPNGKYSNVMTGLQLKLMKQMNIPNILPGTYLTIGYHLDPLQQTMQSRKITLQSTKSVIYSIDLDQAASATAPPSVTIMPQAPPQPNAPRARVRKDAAGDIKKKKSNERE